MGLRWFPKTAATLNTRTRSSLPLISWLASVASIPPQKALIGLFRHSLSKHPSSGVHLNVAIAMMKMVSRLGVKRECGAMTEHWDVTCCAWLSSLSKSGLREDVFLDQHLEVCSLIINAADVKQIKAAADESEVPEELKAVCTSSTLGERVFGPVLAKLALKSYVAEVVAICDEVIQTEVSQGTLDQAYGMAEASAASSRAVWCEGSTFSFGFRVTSE